MEGTPPSQYFRRVGGTELAGVALQRGMNDWDAFESKAGRVSVCDELFLRFNITVTETGSVNVWITYQLIAAECTSVSFQTRTGREILTGLDGEYLSLMHILSRRNLADILLLADATDTSFHKVPIWAGTYAFDLEEYPIAVSDMGALQENRGGQPAGITMTTVTQQLIGRGRYLQEAPTRRREWFMVSDATEVHLPRGRYHHISIVNPKSDNGNLYDGGLTVTGPDMAINNEDGRDLQLAFLEDYGPQRAEMNVAADDPIVLPTMATAFIEDLIQPVYWGGEDSMRWESGVNGPITIRKDDTNDPNMAVYALRCVE